MGPSMKFKERHKERSVKLQDEESYKLCSQSEVRSMFPLTGTAATHSPLTCGNLGINHNKPEIRIITNKIPPPNVMN